MTAYPYRPSVHIASTSIDLTRELLSAFLPFSHTPPLFTDVYT